MNVARQRLLRDMYELERNSLSTVSARCITDNILEWAVSMRPTTGSFKDSVFSLSMNFPINYPNEPPRIQIVSCKLTHPNVFGNYICLDMLTQPDGRPYSGWSRGYTVLSILMQLQSFLFATEGIDQDYGNRTATNWLNPVEIQSVRKQNLRFSCMYGINKHTHATPWPPLEKREGIGCVICGISGDVWGTVIGEEGDEDRQVWKLSNGRIAKKYTQESKWNWKQVIEPVPVARTQDGDIYILDDDAIVNILEYVEVSDIILLKQANKRFMRLIFDNNIITRRNIKCFFTNMPFNNKQIFGTGVNVKKHRNNTIQSVSVTSDSLDIISKDAFDSGVRKNTWNISFTHFIPFAFNKVHFQNILQTQTIQKCITEIINKPATLEDILNVIAHAMNTMVVQLSTTRNTISRVASESALKGYCSFFHLLLSCAMTWTEINCMCSAKIDAFINDPRKRTKDETKDLGIFLAYLLISEYRWEDISTVFIDELLARTVLWVTRDIQASFSNIFDVPSFKTSMSLVLFQIEFIRIVKGNCDLHTVKNNYDRQHGMPSNKQIEDLQRFCNHTKSMNDWHTFTTIAGLPSTSLKDKYNYAVHKSFENGYSRHYSVNDILCKIKRLEL